MGSLLYFSNASVTFSPLSLSTVPNDPLLTQYVSATSTGTTITFDQSIGGGHGGNTNGGSISLLGVPALTDFSGLPYTTTLSLAYAPIAALAPPDPTTLRQAAPFVYGEGTGTTHSGLYYNELDNFFSNSLLATLSSLFSSRTF